MRSFMALALMSISSVAFAVTPNISEEDRISNFYNNHLIEMQNSFNEDFDTNWTAGKAEKVQLLYNFNEEKIGYVVSFTNGYIASTDDYQMLDMSFKDRFCFDDESNKIYYSCGEFYVNKNGSFVNANEDKYNNEIVANGDFSEDIYHKIDVVMSQPEFEFTSSCAKISGIPTKFDQSDWGNYRPVCFDHHGTSDCGVMAIMNLLHTYKISGGANYTKNIPAAEMREQLRYLTNWQGNIVGEGLLPRDLINGCNNYICKKGIALRQMENGLAPLKYANNRPGIGLYFNARISKTAHYAMKIGTAQHKYGWCFKTYLDVIISWDQNFDPDFEGNPKTLYDNDNGVYFVDLKYRHASYQLFENNSWVK